MYCPRCGIENLNEACFCRACGADISLVPQAMTGHLPIAEASVGGKVTRGKKAGRASKEEKVPTLEQAFSNIFIGVGFILWFIIGALFFTRFFPFWFWALFPAFACLGSGVGQYMRIKKAERDENLLSSPDAAMLLSSRVPLITGTNNDDVRLTARDTSEIVSSAQNVPASVTEGTTRLLDETGNRSTVRREQKRG